MDSMDFFALRELFNRSRILLCFNGPISRSLIEEIGNALKNYLQADNALPAAAMDVFGVYIEMTQNIRHYALAMGYDDLDSSATVVVARDGDGRYLVQAGNLVEPADGAALMQRVNELAALDKTELKAAYKAQLRQPRDENARSGAGLGLIDVARKSAQPLCASLSPVNEGRAFFSLRAVI
ncbi:biofilm regulation protein kinase SiaB [Quatrionicoccus australiensis]|uniref:biofilm regulation protein kinase SiaB n=1 Tax=Quatrionicoccus australiensis TaxID=138118 RepID=UPI001CF8499A|nr:biofilm regulation protein kinase SiaB [Quatrionicoccus australiensis]UCV15390.1 biofilm regulation protein kinase SiaB [Quatrionicoccus australiensis]